MCRPSTPHWRSIAVHPPCGMDHAIAGIAGRPPQAEFGPSVEIGDRIYNAPAKLAVNRTGAETAVFFKCSGGQAQMHGCIGRPQEAGYDWCGSGIHWLTPLRFEHSGGLPLVAEFNGEGRTAGGSDRFGCAEIVTP